MKTLANTMFKTAFFLTLVFTGIGFLVAVAAPIDAIRIGDYDAAPSFMVLGAAVTILSVWMRRAVNFLFTHTPYVNN